METVVLEKVENALTLEEIESILHYYQNSYLALSSHDLSAIKKLSTVYYSYKNKATSLNEMSLLK